MGDAIDAAISEQLAISARSDRDYVQRKLAEIVRLAKGPRSTERQRLQRIEFACYMVIGTVSDKTMHGRFWVMRRKALAQLEALAHG